ncbi:MAG: SRPBCC domain-containing protein [Myxococcales bacterium]|nr:SRPBCC domain-containing protein [Myxococcales bacterium]
MTTNDEDKKPGTRAKIVIERTYRADLQDIWDLWTTKEGFESWWGPQGFRADVSEIDARRGGRLRYAMVADSAEAIAAMKQMGEPTSTLVQSRFTELKARERLVLTNVIDFIPNVATYESRIAVDFLTVGDSVRMVVTLDAMHSEEFTKMQKEGFTSQLRKLDSRFG